MKAPTEFIYGDPKRPAFVLCRPSDGKVIFRRHKGRKDEKSLDLRYRDDIAFRVGSIQAARNLVEVAGKLLAAEESRLRALVTQTA